MKTFYILLLMSILCLNVKAQIKVTSTGQVGIRTSNPYPQWDVHICGSTLCFDQAWPNFIIDHSGGYTTLHTDVDQYGYIGTDSKRFGQVSAMKVKCLQTGYYSDRRIKTNIKPVSSAVERLKLLNGVSYDIKSDFFKKAERGESLDPAQYKDRIGFIAQDFQKVFPSLVDYNKEADLYSINYVSLIPVLVEAIKEQQATIEELNKKLAYVANDQPLSSRTDLATTAKLEQNQPNPFSQMTSIKYYVPENATVAKINIYNLNGTQLESYNLDQKGNGILQINGGKLTPGIYIYNLIIDGKEIDFKRMVLTQ